MSDENWNSESVNFDSYLDCAHEEKVIGLHHWDLSIDKQVNKHIDNSDAVKKIKSVCFPLIIKYLISTCKGSHTLLFPHDFWFALTFPFMFPVSQMIVHC